MSPVRLGITHEPLSVERLSEQVLAEARARDRACGALATFVGLVRATHEGRVVLRLEYEAFEPLAITAFDRIEREVAEQWPQATLGMVHRVGLLNVGEASIVIAVATPHRAESFQACRYAIERVKQIAPIWKHEFFVDGEAWVEGAIADPEDEVARRQARARACA